MITLLFLVASTLPNYYCRYRICDYDAMSGRLFNCTKEKTAMTQEMSKIVSDYIGVAGTAVPHDCGPKQIMDRKK